MEAKLLLADVLTLEGHLKYTYKIELKFELETDRFAGIISCESYENASHSAEIYLTIGMRKL